MGCVPSRGNLCCGADGVKDQTSTANQHGDENSSAPLPDDHGSVSEGVFAFPLEGGETKHEEGQPQDKQDHGSASGGVFAFPLGGGEARHEDGQPQDKQGPMGKTPTAAGEDSTPATKSDSGSRDNDTLTSKLLGSSPKDKVANEAASESSSEQSEQDKDKDNDKNDGGFVETIAEKLGMISSDEEEDKTAAAAAADANTGPTEETPAATSEDPTPAAKSDSDSRDNDTLTSKLLGSSPKDKEANEAASESSSEQSEQDKDNVKNDGGFVETVAEKLGMISSDEEEDKTAAPAADANADEDGGNVTGAVIGLLFGGGEARHEEGQPQDEEGPTKETSAAASEDSTPAAKSDSDSRDNNTLTSKLFGPGPKDKVANEAAGEPTSEQSEQDKDNDKNDRGFVGMIAEKLGLVSSEEKEDETAAPAVDADAEPTEETPAAASEDSTPAAKSDSDSRDKSTLTSKLFGPIPKGKGANEPAAEPTSEQSEQDKDKDNDKNDGGFFGMIAKNLGLAPSNEEEDKTAAPAAADADAGATT